MTETRVGLRMRWWRLRRFGAARFGLLAMLFQLLLSFGHVHAQDLMPAQSPANQHAACEVSSGSRDFCPREAPDDQCAICITLHMTAAGVPPAPPAVLSVSVFHQTFPPTLIDAFNPGTPRHSLFETRAPPTA